MYYVEYVSKVAKMGKLLSQGPFPNEFKADSVARYLIASGYRRVRITQTPMEPPKCN